MPLSCVSGAIWKTWVSGQRKAELCHCSTSSFEGQVLWDRFLIDVVIVTLLSACHPRRTGMIQFPQEHTSSRSSSLLSSFGVPQASHRQALIPLNHVGKLAIGVWFQLTMFLVYEICIYELVYEICSLSEFFTNENLINRP